MTKTLLTLSCFFGTFGLNILKSQIDTAWIRDNNLEKYSGYFFGRDKLDTRSFCLNLSNGKLHGISSLKMEDSKIYYEQNFINNKKDGDTFCYINNRLAFIDEYRNDTLLNKTVYSNSGHKIITTYEAGLIRDIKIYRPSGVLDFEKLYVGPTKLYSIWYYKDRRIKKVVIWTEQKSEGDSKFKYDCEFRLSKKGNFRKLDNISEKHAIDEYDFLKTKTHQL